MSLEEQRARQEGAAGAAGEGGGAAGGGGGAAGAPAVGPPAPDVPFEAMTEEEQLAFALRMSMADGESLTHFSDVSHWVSMFICLL